MMVIGQIERLGQRKSHSEEWLMTKLTMLAMLAMRYVSLYWKTTPASIYNLVG